MESTLFLTDKAGSSCEIDGKQKVTAQIVSGIENEMANKVQKNGGDLNTVKKSIRSSAETGDKVRHFNPRKQFKP